MLHPPTFLPIAAPWLDMAGLALLLAGLPLFVAATIAATAGFALRAAAIHFKLALPSYRGRR